MSARATLLSRSVLLFALAACGGDDAPTSPPAGATAAGSAGATAAGSAGATAAGSAGATAAGSAGTTAAGSAGATAAGSAGATAAGSAGATAAGSAGATAAGSAGATAAGSAGKAGAPQATIATCRMACATATDCETPSVPILTGSHYSCDAGLCVWGGCATDLECQHNFQKPNYACDKSAAVPSCVQTCTKADDCVNPGAPIYGVDHYACASGRCAWKGCKSDGECQQALSKPSARCATQAGAAVPTCVPGCATADDCALGAAALYAADHYACTSGSCEWKGCKGDGECQQAFSNGGYVCR